MHTITFRWQCFLPHQRHWQWRSPENSLSHHTHQPPAPSACRWLDPAAHHAAGASRTTSVMSSNCVRRENFLTRTPADIDDAVSITHIECTAYCSTNLMMAHLIRAKWLHLQEQTRRAATVCVSVCVCVLTSAEDQSGTHGLCLADINTDREEARCATIHSWTTQFLVVLHGMCRLTFRGGVTMCGTKQMSKLFFSWIMTTRKRSSLAWPRAAASTHS